MNTKKISLLFALTLAVTIVCGSFPLKTTNTNAESRDYYTITSDDAYYAETTYFLTETAYNNYSNNSLTEPTHQPTARAANTQNNNEFVAAVEQKVYIYQETNNDGAIENSRLLHKDELIDTYSKPLDPTIPTTEEIGYDSESLYYPTINMTVIYDTKKENYKITATAKWEKKLVASSQSYKAAEEKHFDFIGITWGGERSIVSQL